MPIHRASPTRAGAGHDGREGTVAVWPVGFFYRGWSRMLSLPQHVHDEMVAHCLSGLPEEACGLLGGDPARDQAVTCYPTRNLAASAKLYTVDPKDYLRADRDADAAGYSIIGVFHSHTHTEAFPSPTDVGQAPDPSWHYVLVSLRDVVPVVRSFRIVDGQISEEPMALQPS
ncbi:MAG: M67 family metallopeptidase [Acidimicrobiales bacterium]